MNEVRIGEKIEEPRQRRAKGAWRELAEALPFGEWHLVEGIAALANARASLSHYGVLVRQLPDGRYAVYRKPPIDGAVS